MLLICRYSLNSLSSLPSELATHGFDGEDTMPSVPLMSGIQTYSLRLCNRSDIDILSHTQVL